MNDSVLVSIVLPVYNVEKYIKRALDSLKNQTLEYFEAIIIDDCGKDNSIKIAEEYVKSDSRFKIFYHDKNLGTFHARRTGVIKSTGSYILFLDPDDELVNNTLELLLSHAVNKPDIIFFGTKLAPPPKIWQGRSSVPVLKNISGRVDLVSTLLNSKGFNFGTEGKLINKSVLERAYCRLHVPNDVKLVYSEDSLLFSALLMELNSATSSSECLYIYHKNPTSITVREDVDVVKVRVLGLQKSIEYIELFDVDSNFDGYVKNKIIRRFKANLIRQDIKLSHGYIKTMSSYLVLVLKTKSFRSLIKFIIYACTFKKY